jgi:hypothetical protein
MTAHAVKLEVIAGIPKNCSFLLEDGVWIGVCEELSVTVRGSSLRTRKRRWKKLYRFTSRVSSVSISVQVERRLPEGLV